MVDEPPSNVDVADAELARELSTPWKYFVLFVSLNMDVVMSPEWQSDQRRETVCIQSKQCRAEQLEVFFHRSLFRYTQLLQRVVFAFTPRMRAEDATSPALCYSVRYDSPPPQRYHDSVRLSTTGFVFAVSGRRYVATSLHGLFHANRQHIPTRGDVLLADAFRADDDKLANVGEVGHVICDWRSNYVDVALIQLLDDEQQPDTAFHTEAEVVGYMRLLMRATVQSRTTRVLVHTAPCLGGGDGTMPGAIVWVGCIDSTTSDSCRKWHFIIQLDRPLIVQLGQSGSAVTLADGGLPIGMLTARCAENHSRAVVTPLHHLYAALNDVLGPPRPLRLCRVCPATVATSRLATKRIELGRVYCMDTGELHSISFSPPSTAVDGVQCCCPKHSYAAIERLERMRYDKKLAERRIENIINNVPHSRLNFQPSLFGFT